MKMKKIVLTSVLAVLATQSIAADLSASRDALFKTSSEAGNAITKAGNITVDKTVSIADLTAGKLKAIISKSLESSTDASGRIGKKIVQLSEVSQPVFRMTADGLAVVFDASKKAGDQTLEASNKLIILLSPSLHATGKELSDIIDQLAKISEPATESSLKALSKILDEASKGSQASSEISTKVLNELYKVSQKPIEVSSDVLAKLFEASSKGSDASTQVTNDIIGKQNVENALELTGNGISLTSKGISAAFYFVTKATSGISNIFNLNREEIEKAVERNDQDTLAGLRELIRAEINKSIQGGETLNQLLSDNDLDFYIEARLEVMKN